MCFDWSLLSGETGRSTQTRQGPMLSTYSTVEHLGRSVQRSGGAGHGRRWRFLSSLGRAAVDVSRAMTEKLDKLLEAWSEALLPGAYAPELASEYAALSRVEVAWRLPTPQNQRAGLGTVFFGITHEPTQRGIASAMRFRFPNQVCSFSTISSNLFVSLNLWYVQSWMASGRIRAMMTILMPIFDGSSGLRPRSSRTPLPRTQWLSFRGCI